MAAQPGSRDSICAEHPERLGVCGTLDEMNTIPSHTHPPLSGRRVRQFWDTLEVTPVDCDTQATSTVLRWLRTDRHKGGAHLQGFRVDGGDDFAWFARDQLLGHLQDILPHPRIRELFPDSFGVTDPLTYTTDRHLVGWHIGTSLELAAQWARALYSGSFYTEPYNLTDVEKDARAEQALTAASDLYRDLFNGRYGSVSVATTRDPWCQWFPGLFNTTWASYDQHQRTLWLLAITDMD